MVLNHCPNCNYNNNMPAGTDYIVTDAKGNPVKNADDTDMIRQSACARCRYAKTAERYAEDKAEALKPRDVEAGEVKPVQDAPEKASEAPEEAKTAVNLPKEDVPPPKEDVPAQEVVIKDPAAIKDPAEAEAEAHRES